MSAVSQKKLCRAVQIDSLRRFNSADLQLGLTTESIGMQVELSDHGI